jgi:alkylresorcinol/alkylpyrone synthase
LGLARAAALAKATPGTNVLFVVVELCGLTFRRRDQSKSNVIASALFGDGAAAALVSCAGEGPCLAAWGEHTWPASLDVMGWRVEDDGLGVLFSRDIPTIVRDGFRPALDGFLARHGLVLADIDHFLCHPGGAKVIAALEDAFELQQGGLALARAVLKDFGNMSAATVLFVLDKALAGGAGRSGRSLLSAVGPGFSAGFMILEPA